MEITFNNKPPAKDFSDVAVYTLFVSESRGYLYIKLNSTEARRLDDGWWVQHVSPAFQCIEVKSIEVTL